MSQPMALSMLAIIVLTSSSSSTIRARRGGWRRFTMASACSLSRLANGSHFRRAWGHSVAQNAGKFRYYLTATREDYQA